MTLHQCPECRGSGHKGDGCLKVGPGDEYRLQQPSICILCQGHGIVKIEPIKNAEDALEASIWPGPTRRRKEAASANFPPEAPRAR